MSHEKEEEGKYFISFSVAGKELGRKEVLDDFEDRSLNNVDIGLFMEMGDVNQEGFTRRLIVLEK